MRSVLILIVALTFSGGNSLENEITQTPNARISASINNWIGLTELNKISTNINSQKGSIDIQINEIVDLLLGYLKTAIINSGLDPVELNDEVIQLRPSGTLTLSDGWLQDISTLSRHDDVVIRFSSTDKKLSLSLPIGFDALSFDYKYHTRYILIIMYGGVIGKISNIKIDMEFSFDTCNSTLAVDKFSLKDTGDITVKFTGNNLIDWLINAMTSALTSVLHPVIIGIVETFVKTAADDLVEAINDFIHS